MSSASDIRIIVSRSSGVSNLYRDGSSPEALSDLFDFGAGVCCNRFLGCMTACPFSRTIASFKSLIFAGLPTSLFFAMFTPRYYGSGAPVPLLRLFRLFSQLAVGS
jgi:hypothetical protein